MLKIDTHAHYLPRDWPDLAGKYGDNRFPVIHHGDDGRHRIYKDGKFFREIWPKTWDPQIRIDDYAGFGVQVQVLSTVPVMFSYWAKPQHAHDLHQALNDHMAEALRDYPRHYAGIGTVPLQSPRLAIQELERCMDQLGLQGGARRRRQIGQLLGKQVLQHRDGGGMHGPPRYLMSGPVSKPGEDRGGPATAHS